MKNRIKNRRSSTKVPALKSASGAGFTFEDKVAALLFCEMLKGKPSLGADWGIIDRIERQAGDWEPFGDLLLTIPNADGKLVKCGCSVKSNRQITTNGCDAEMCGNLWNVIAKPVFDREADAIGLFCAELSKNVSQPLNELCQQARNEDTPHRFDEKISDKKHRKIYASFASTTISGEKGLPHHILSRLIPREFDFEDATSRDEAAAISLCLETLQPASATTKMSCELWKALLDIAQELRITGGSTTRERLTAKLRNRFQLRDDPSDVNVWENIHTLSREWLDQIESRLPGGLTLPRNAEIKALRNELAANRACHVIGESGSGKSALVKALVGQNVTVGAELVWIKAELFSQMRKAAPTFIEAALRVRRSAAFIVIDGIEACYDPSTLQAIAETISTLTADADSPWRIILTCQTPEWSRISFSLVKTLAGKAVLARQVECGELSGEDFALVCASHASVFELSRQPHLRRILKSPKMLDVLLSGQHAENRALVSEADFVEWWWDQQVRQSKAIAAEETVARQLASRMADELCTELAPDAVAGAEAAAATLVRNRVLYRTRDGRLRFNHDLLADWSRVMHLRSLGRDALDFMRTHAENPPWLRAIRLLSQHMLERTADFDQWRAVVATCSTKPKENEEPPAENLQILDPWLEGVAYCVDAKTILDRLKPELFSNDGWLLRRFVSRLLHVGTIPDPVIQDRFRQMDSTAVEMAGVLFRLPQERLWTPVINFLIQNKAEATDFLPVELADIASMWSRLEEYLQTPWSVLADTILLNGEKELHREVAGEYRHDRGPISLGGGHKSRVKIYTAALQAASQFPDRAAKLLLKAAGRAPWDEGDVSQKAREGWRGEWHEHSPFGRWHLYIKEPPESWPDGPNRNTSDDFFHAWFESGVAQILYKKRPEVACEATLAFVIDWPKSELIKGQEHHGYEVEHRGFTSEASHMYPPFWLKGNFLGFLRLNWRPALEMIIRLVNFATDRHQEWWNHAEVTIQTPKGKTRWKGHPHIYAWHHFNMNSADVVTCALMALEKWFDEQLKEGKPIKEAVELLYEKSNSFASAGLLISLGKRFPHLFTDELKPLLFIQDFYICDIHSTMNYFGAGFWPQDGKIINNLRREWSQLPGRKTTLKNICFEWLVANPAFAEALKEVSTAWRQNAEKFPEGSEDRIVLLRWAADFDRSLWKEVTLPDGRSLVM
jgi:energy-coupling factor transporter ATP-binding protein EcfA2